MLAPSQLSYQQKRYRGKINLKKPKIFYTKSLVNTLLTPFFINPNKNKSLDELCLNLTSTDKENELGTYEKIIMKDVRNWMDKSKMTACIHVNSMRQEDLFDIIVPLRKANMYYKWYGPRIVREAIKDSPYEGLGPLLSEFTSFVFSPDINVIALEKIMKKCPQIYTLGGVLEGQVLKYDEFMKFGQMDITTAQVGLVQVLQNAGGLNLHRQLNHHQSTLVTRLEQIGTNETAPEEKDESVPV